MACLLDGRNDREAKPMMDPDSAPFWVWIGIVAVLLSAVYAWSVIL